jgi:hypothetical protein
MNCTGTLINLPNIIMHQNTAQARTEVCVVPIVVECLRSPENFNSAHKSKSPSLEKSTNEHESRNQLQQCVVNGK